MFRCKTGPVGRSRTPLRFVADVARRIKWFVLLCVTVSAVVSPLSHAVDISSEVISVTVPDSRTYVAGNTLRFVVHTSEPVEVTGTPQIALLIGPTTKHATYVSGSLTSALEFSYTIETGLTDVDGITVNALMLNGGTIKDSLGYGMALTLNNVGSTANVLVDSMKPTVTAVVSPNANTTYGVGDTITINVILSEIVSIVRIPTLTLATGAEGRAIPLESITRDSLTFKYVVQEGDTSSDLDYLNATALSLNGGSLRDSAGNDADLTLPVPGQAGSLSANKALVIDGVAPTISSVSVPSARTYTEAMHLEFVVNLSEIVTVNTTGGTPRIAVTIGDKVRYATYASGSGTNALVFRYTIDTSDYDADGITVAGTLNLNGGAIVDGARNNMVTTLTSVGNTTEVLVKGNGVFPAAPSIPDLAEESDTGVSSTDNLTNDTSPTLIGTAEANTTVSLYQGTNLLGEGTTQDGKWTITLVGLSEGTHNIAAIATDVFGNGSSFSQPLELTVDLHAASATVNVAKTQLGIEDTSLVTITFSEPVVDFDNGDLTVTNGTLTAVSSTDGGKTWTATFTPDANINDATNVIILDYAGIQDRAGNSGMGSTASNSFSINTVPRTFVVTSFLTTGDDASMGNLADDELDGDGLSLREALFWALAGETITFSRAGEIALDGGGLLVRRNVIIDGDLDGDGLPDVTINANGASQIMAMTANDISLEINGLIFTGGDTDQDGGALYSSFDNSTIVIRNSRFINNKAGLRGGAIHSSGGIVTIINSSLSGNTSAGNGSAVSMTGFHNQLTLINTTVTGNTTLGNGEGGAIYVGQRSLTIVNSTISGNNAAGGSSRGGGILVGNTETLIYNSTIVGNTATYKGGGIATEKPLKLYNSVVAGNRAGNSAIPASTGTSLATGGNPDDLGESVLTEAYNSYIGTQATVTEGSNNLINQGTGRLLLGDLASHVTGAPLTHSPLAGSALIDAGSNSVLPLDTYDLNNNGNTTEALPYDARGNERVRGVVDIGAVEGNSKPVITGTPASSVNENATYSFTPTVVDAEGDTLTFSITNKPTWATFSTQTGHLTGTPDPTHIGTTSGIVISVSDGNSTVSLDSFNISVANVKDAPTISGTPVTTASQGDLYAFTPTASDQDANDSLTFSATGLPSWLTLNSATGTLSGTPANSHVGTSGNIVITVSDGELTASLPAFNITVANVNDAPTIAGTPPTTINAGSGYTFTPIASDIDVGDVLGFTASGLPAWLSINPVTGVLSGVPTESDVGTTGAVVIRVSDGELTASLPAFAIEVVSSSDQSTPVVTAPNDLTLNATGLFTAVSRRQLLGLPDTADQSDVTAALQLLAYDSTSGNQCCTVNVSGSSGDVVRLKPGRNELVWTATNAEGKSGQALQVVNINPLVSLSPSQIAVRGGAAQIRFMLNGVAPAYPFTVNFSISAQSTATAQEHNLSNGSVAFVNEGQVVAEIPVVLSAVTGYSDSQLIVELDNGVNKGAVDKHVLHIREGNLAPLVNLNVVQNHVGTRFIESSGGAVTVTAMVSDANANDTHTYDWSATTTLTDIDENAADATFTFEPTGLSGVHELTVDVTDSAGAITRVSQSIRIVDLRSTNENVLQSFLANVLPQQLTSLDRYLVECDAGVTCEIGRFALASQTGGVQILNSETSSIDGLIADDDYTPIGGIFDFVIRHQSPSEESVRIVIPQRTAIPENAVYRKFNEGRWMSFLSDNRNAVHSAQGELGYCPPPGSSEWTTGLTAGHWCVQLTLQDGGPNDADARVNYTVVDPGAVSIPKPKHPEPEPTPPMVEPPAVQPTPPVIVKSKGGGAVEGLWILLLFSLVFVRRLQK